MNMKGTLINTTSSDQAHQWQQLQQWFPASTASVGLDQVRAAIDQKTKPPGSLGQLELIAAQLALLQNTLTPSVNNTRIIVFGADHGIAEEGVSAFPSEVTAQMMANFANGGAAVSVLSKANGTSVEVVDAGVNGDLSQLASVINAKVAAGTANFSTTAAMNTAELQVALDVGKQAVQRAMDNNTDCIGLGEMGIANTSSASAIVALLLDVPASTVTGRGTGVDDEALRHKTNVIQNAIELHRPACGDVLSTLQYVGGFEIAAITGAILEASKHQLPVLVDGFICTAAALAAVRYEPATRACLLFAHQSAESGHAVVLDALQATPMLKLQMRLGEGSAAALAYPLLRSACAMMTNMSTFADAGVSDKPK